jgi:DNA-binding response OmpR family regulator
VAQERIRVLVADEDTLLVRRLHEYIASRGFETRLVHDGNKARTLIQEWRPRFVLADLMLEGMNALELIDSIKSDKSLRHSFIDVLIMSRHNLASNVKNALARGAKDYIVRPFSHEDIIKRLVFHARNYRHLSEISNKDYTRIDEASLMLHLTDLVLKQALDKQPLEEILFNLTRMVALKVEGVRCSIIQCLDHKLGLVVSSNDNRQASGIQLDLYKYPEVLHVMNTQNLVAVENLRESAELRSIASQVKDIVFNSLVVCPVSRYGQPFGVLSLRMPPIKETISDNEIRFVEIVAHVTSLVLSNEIHKQSEDFWSKGDPRAVGTIPLRAVKNS